MDKTYEMSVNLGSGQVVDYILRDQNHKPLILMRRPFVCRLMVRECSIVPPPPQLLFTYLVLFNLVLSNSYVLII